VKLSECDGWCTWSRWQIILSTRSRDCRTAWSLGYHFYFRHQQIFVCYWMETTAANADSEWSDAWPVLVIVSFLVTLTTGTDWLFGETCASLPELSWNKIVSEFVVFVLYQRIFFFAFHFVCRSRRCFRRQLRRIFATVPSMQHRWPMTKCGRWQGWQTLKSLFASFRMASTPLLVNEESCCLVGIKRMSTSFLGDFNLWQFCPLWRFRGQYWLSTY